ncbi:MAG: hypothetical protein GIW99_07355 [Candidatus Eremiobacteraeota bacterium]|nr:hypothetical protein [Candidatus Eremiobacteraeota bacterium]MBC5827480.1 hypothetical protein [Candidatus Eremiobacteraeota bacterium]
MAEDGVPVSWATLFKALKFGSANWDFSSWSTKLSAVDNTRSFRIATRIFSQLFHDGALPSGIGTVDLYFRGNNATVIVQTSKPTKTGAYSRKSGANTHIVNPKQAINVIPITADRFLKLNYTSSNVEVDDVEDLASPRTDPKRYKALTRIQGAKGLLIDTTKKVPLKLNFRVALFGGIAWNCEVDITW